MKDKKKLKWFSIHEVLIHSHIGLAPLYLITLAF